MGNMVLIVEDEQELAELIKDRLDAEGFQTKIAYTGGEALKQLQESNPDLVTLDIYLPDTNGLKVLKDIKTNPKTYKTPVIMVSSADEEKAARDLGAEDFVKKPINFKKLFEVIDQVKKEHKK